MVKRVVTTETVDDGAELPEDGEFIEVIEGEEDEDQQLDALEGMIAEFSGAADAIVNVYKQGDGKNLAFLFRTNPGEMSGGEIMERCRDRYGTGDYRVHIRKGPRLVANKPFSCVAENIEETAKPNGGLDTMAFITMMQESNKQTMVMFTEAMKAFAGSQNSAPTFDPVAAQASLMQQLVSLKGLAEPKDESKGAIEMFVQGISLAKELGGSNGETNTSDILLEALKTFGQPLAEAAQQMKANTPPGNGALPPPGDPQAANDAAREREMGIRQAMMRQQLGFLIQNAAAGKNAELYAELLLDQLGEKVVLEFIAKPDAMEKLIAINPDVATHRGWFEALRFHILELTGGAGDTDNQGAPIIQHGGVIIPGADQTDAIPDAAIDGDVTGASTGDSGDAQDA